MEIFSSDNDTDKDKTTAGKQNKSTHITAVRSVVSLKMIEV